MVRSGFLDSYPGSLYPSGWVENPVRQLFLAPILCCVLTWTLSDDTYFPVKMKAGDEGVTAFEAQWYGKSLERMKEPRLPVLAMEAFSEVYRVLILPTWGDSIVIRVQKHGQTYELFARRLNGQAGYEVGQLVEAKDIDLSADDSRTLDMLLQNLAFFQLPTDDEVRGFDGDEWILEGVSQGKYHVVQRWCAASYKSETRNLNAFLALCKFLVDKSTLSERPSNKGHKLI